LLDTVVRPGVLKPQINAAPVGVQYELVSEAGALLWKGTMPDPNVLHLEYDDPPGSGVLKRKTVVLPEAEFTVRVPVLPQAKRLDFYRLEAPASGATGEKSITRKLLGSLSLP
jgi:hypothetical protein